jgi:membrane protein implicated in regulation of membrane protease activity
VALLIGGTLALIFLDLPSSVVVIALLAGVEIFEFRLWRWAVRQRPMSGSEGLIGERGKLIADGRVRIRGTSYQARTSDAEPGDDVIVEGADGLTLTVTKADEPTY